MCSCYRDGDFGGVTGKDWQFGFDFFFVKTEEFVGSLEEQGRQITKLLILTLSRKKRNSVVIMIYYMASNSSAKLGVLIG